MKFIVWGAGNDLSQYKEQLRENTIWLVDSDISRHNTIYEGYLIETTDIINQIEYDYVVVASRKYYEEISGILLEKYKVKQEKIILISELEKEVLFREIGRKHSEGEKKVRILFGYCFLIYENCRINDFLLAESLRRRGAEIIPLVCGGLQELQCSVYGGQWGNKTHCLEEKQYTHKDNCKKCQEFDKKVWNCWGNYDVLSAADYITQEEMEQIKESVKQYDVSSLLSWEYNGYPIGVWALKTYYNIEVISHKDSYSEYEEMEVKSLAYNVIIMCIATERCVDRVNPDIIYSNDSFYYPYCILETVAKRKGKPFYNAYCFRKNTYAYAMNAPSISMPLESAWKSFGKRGLTDKEHEFMKRYVQQRRMGKDMLIDFSNVRKSIEICREEAVHGEIKEKKKVALLATNVTWDAAALFKEIVFSSMREWVVETVEFFVKHPEWQLIVRAHPAENVKGLPQANELIGKIILEKYEYKLPDNIVVIESDAPISIYDILPVVDIGIVHTSTIGIEMSCMGIPVITTGKAPYRDKGVTYDPKDKEAYFALIEDLFSKEAHDKEMVDKAEAFFFLYYFIYMFPNPFYQYTYEEGAKLLFTDKKFIDVGNNELWDYVCNSIMSGEAILSQDKFPPYKVDDFTI